MKDLELEAIHNRLTKLLSSEELFGEDGASAYWKKHDNEYVSNFDLQINKSLQIVLREVLDVPVLSEERETPTSLPRIYWLVDPLDGTHNHIAELAPTAARIALMLEAVPVVAFIRQLGDGYVRSTFRGAGKMNNGSVLSSVRVSQRLIGLSTGVIDK